VQELLQLHGTLEPLMDLAILMASVADEERSVELLTLVRGVAASIAEPKARPSDCLLSRRQPLTRSGQVSANSGTAVLLDYCAQILVLCANI
jgi:hypothetical protein